MKLRDKIEQEEVVKAYYLEELEKAINGLSDSEFIKLGETGVLEFYVFMQEPSDAEAAEKLEKAEKVIEKSIGKGYFEEIMQKAGKALIEDYDFECHMRISDPRKYRCILKKVSVPM